MMIFAAVLLFLWVANVVAGLSFIRNEEGYRNGKLWKRLYTPFTSYHSHKDIGRVYNGIPMICFTNFGCIAPSMTKIYIGSKHEG